MAEEGGGTAAPRSCHGGRGISAAQAFFSPHALCHRNFLTLRGQSSAVPNFGCSREASTTLSQLLGPWLLLPDIDHGVLLTFAVLAAQERSSHLRQPHK